MNDNFESLFENSKYSRDLKKGQILQRLEAFKKTREKFTRYPL